MKTLQAFAVVAAVAFWTLWACERHARADADACVSALAPAAENVQLAGEAVASCWGPAECAVSRELLASAKRQHAAALALCPAPRPDLPKPNPEADDFEDWGLAQIVDRAVPVPGVPYLVDPVVEAECPGLRCPIVIVPSR